MDKISISDYEFENYEQKLSQFLSKINHNKRKQYSYFNDKVTQIHGCNLYEIFDYNTGGIRIEDYEWVLCDSVLKKIFSKKRDKSFIYACPLDDGVLLRGSACYYYLVCYMEKGSSLTDIQIREWNKNIIYFLQMAKNILSRNIYQLKLNSLIELKLLLGILDNMRHFILHCLNIYIALFKGKSNCISLKENNRFEECKLVLTRIHNKMEQLIFEENKDFEKKDFLQECIEDISCLIYMIDDVFKRLLYKSDITRKTCLKIHREADSFLENYITMKYIAIQIMKKNKKKIRIFSIMSGANELAIMLVNLLEKYVPQLWFVDIHENYLTRHSKKSSSINKKFKNNNEYFDLIVDDNVMTGDTIAETQRILFDYLGILSFKCAILRHPEINRIAQMRAYNKAVNISFLETYCIGMINDSPYSRIQLGTNIGNEYLDECGIFTLTGDYFLKILYKNRDYTKFSEVGYYSRKYYEYKK